MKGLAWMVDSRLPSGIRVAFMVVPYLSEWRVESKGLTSVEVSKAATQKRET